MSHTKEPWEADGWYADGGGNVVAIVALGGREEVVGEGGLSDANQDRIVQCVNALAGVEDPAAAIQAALNVLLDVSQTIARKDHPIMLRNVDTALRLLGGSQ